MVVRLDPPPNVLQMDDTGTIRVAGTRITLDTLIGAYKRGDTPQEIAEGFPSLGLAVIYSVIAYYLHHQSELDAYLAEGERQAQEFRRQHPEMFEHDLKQRLQERAKARRKD
jgi:uncharacterized protein (DUF433 family)